MSDAPTLWRPSVQGPRMPPRTSGGRLLAASASLHAGLLAAVMVLGVTAPEPWAPPMPTQVELAFETPMAAPQTAEAPSEPAMVEASAVEATPIEAAATEATPTEVPPEPPLPPATADVAPQPLPVAMDMPQPSAPMPPPASRPIEVPQRPEPPRLTRPAPTPPQKRPATTAKPEVPRTPTSPASATSTPAAPATGTAPAQSQSQSQSPAAAAQTPTPPPEPGPLLITQPRFRTPPTPPAYPQLAREQGQEGEAVIRARLDLEGNPEEVVLQASSGFPMLDRAALAAVRRWLFEPARRGGAPSIAWVQIPVRFALR